MEKYILYKIVLIFLVLSLFYSCSPTRHVGKGEYLLNRVEVKVENTNVNKSELKKNIRQKPNTRILGVARFHLGLYNLSGRNENKRLNKWLRSIGEAPVVYSPFLTDRTKTQIGVYLNNKGYYGSFVTDTVWFKKKKAYVEYRVVPGEVTRVKEYTFQDRAGYVSNELADSTEIMRMVLSDTLNTLLRKGMPMDVEVLDKERERIIQMLRSNGYYNFSRNFIQYYADTAVTEKKEVAHLLVSITDNPGDSLAYRKYQINKIRISLDYEPMLVMNGGDTVYTDIMYREYVISYRDRLKISPGVIVETIQFKPGELYNMKKVADSYSRLQALNLFKYINIVFREKRDEKGEVSLDCDIQLTPVKRQSYNVFLEGTNNSGNIGVGGNFSYNHRNLFHGAENVTFSVWGALKKEQINENKIFSTTELGTELKLITPQFWMPFFRLKDFRRDYAPKTSVSLSYSHEKTPFYLRQIASAKFGYLWRKSDRKWRYSFDLIDLNYVLMKNVDTGFINGLKNEYVKSAYTDHLILSANFSAIFTDQLSTQSSYNYFRGNLESSGNMLWIFDKILNASSWGEELNDPYYRALGVRYAQFIKADGEYRFNHYINRANTIVYRLFAGCGYPYGNMKALPFEEAYFCGGANGIRAWHSRTLGPGSYSADDRYPNSVGDFKMEVNAEYRFKLFWLLEGALFLDVGNIWNINKFEDREGTKLSKDFYRQLAVGTGAGLRLDANFFLLRFDLGIKMRDPARPPGQRFILLNSNGGFKHSVFNIAIGYPF